jgi:signal transduction histidine kinase
MASHDLRSPLSALRLQLHALRKELQPGTQCPVPQKTSQRVESMERQIVRMLQMMDALMDISQMTAGRLELKRQNLDLVGVARDVVSRLEEELRQSGVEVRLHAQGPVKGAWDRTRLEQVIDNLLSNAIKYGEGRPVDLILSADENAAELVVKDQGVGISPEDQERLFERFERVRLNREVTGYGVGLWIVRRVVEAHGGSTSVRSRLGEGAAFIVRLPLRSPEGTAPGRANGPGPDAHPPSMH